MKAQTVFWYAEFKSIVRVHKEYRRVFNHDAPTAKSIKKWHDTFLATGSVLKKHGGSRRTSDEMVANVHAAYERSPRKDLRDLRERIIEAIESIPVDMIQCAWQEIVHRLDIITVTVGAHVEICRARQLTSEKHIASFLLNSETYSHEEASEINNNVYHILMCECPKTILTKLEQRSCIKIEMARGHGAQECFQGLREACGDAALPYRTVARWVKAFREGLLHWYQREGDDFLGRIVAMDETWTRSYEPNLKRQSNKWKHPGSPRPKKVRPTQSAVKEMFIWHMTLMG
ncbi:hypothetical protein ANN_02712 [Periplaneta americana]|uniref:Mos1 transposase HTH domain-containing protein n=1 Tax=Periplaneta americana TaxID=6978 RepID=A0ABQ8TYQ9_PERAM|nr:hypothetical protein ANN_02712 [Periplaneta americana]